MILDFFKKKPITDVVEPPPPPPEPEKEKPAHTYYRLGLTDNNRVSLSMGYAEITMNAAGIDGMIKLLLAYKEQLKEMEAEEENE